MAERQRDEDGFGSDDGFPAVAGSEREAGRLGKGTLALLGGAALALLLGLFFYYSDRNSDRYELRCSRGRAEARQGRYFPWGTGSIDDEAHAPIALPPGLSCAGARFSSLAELDQAFAALLLETADARLSGGGPDSLASAREEVERATRLQGLTDEQRARTEALLADMVYHEARELLRQVERDLWQARRRLERARALGAGERIGELDDWLEFVETETERFRPALAGSRDGEPSGPARPEDAGPPPELAPGDPADVFL